VSISYYGYDWSLNEVKILESAAGVEQPPSGNNAIRYVVSSTIPKGNTETKIFNNLYTQSFGDEPDGNRSTFFTSQISSLYGVSNTFNAGIELRYRRVLNSGLPSSSTDVFGINDTLFRQGITTIGPKIRWAPVPKWGNFSIQSTLWFPLEGDLEGGNNTEGQNKIYADWNSPRFGHNSSMTFHWARISHFSLKLTSYGKIWAEKRLTSIGFQRLQHSF